MRVLIGLCLGIIAALALISWERQQMTVPEQPRESSLSLASLLAEDSAGFSPVDRVVEFRFPADHGPHPSFRNEWWYLTGNLIDVNGRPFGYQLTFFRRALSPPPEKTATERESSFATQQIYMAHLAISDLQNNQLHATERFSRAAAGLAGAKAEPLEVWLEDWFLRALPGVGPGADFSAELRAHEPEAGIDLRVRSLRPIALQGDRGLSAKTADGSTASYYYSITRLQTEGELRLGEERFVVTGTSWLDREWSSEGLANDQSGWDWFALHLSDGRDLMWYRLRDHQGEKSHASGILVQPDGTFRSLGPRALVLSVEDHWQSERSGVRYPSRWRLQLPEAQLDLRVEPRADDQELDLGVRYWEGAVVVRGSAGSTPTPITGEGYVELTGYGPQSGTGYGGSRSSLHSR